MIRKIVISVLTLLAVAVGAAWVLPLPTLRLGNIEPCEVTAWVVRRSSWLPGDTLRIRIIQVDYHRKTWLEPVTELVSYSHHGPPIPRYGPFLGLEFARSVSEMDSNIYKITTAKIPLVHLFIIFAAYSTLVLIKTIRGRHRVKPGHCSKCGYDLTGNISGVCPECGTTIFRKSEPLHTSQATGGQI